MRRALASAAAIAAIVCAVVLGCAIVLVDAIADRLRGRRQAPRCAACREWPATITTADDAPLCGRCYGDLLIDERAGTEGLAAMRES